MKPDVLSDEEFMELRKLLFRSDCLHDTKDAASKVVAFYEPKLEQARKDTAREIFGEIENLMLHFAENDGENSSNITIEARIQEWKALKQKYLGGEQ